MTAMPTFRVQTLNWNTVLKEQLGAQVSGVYWWGGLGWCAEWRWAYRKILGSGRHNCNSIVTVSFAIGVNSKCPEPSCRNLCKKRLQTWIHFLWKISQFGNHTLLVTPANLSLSCHKNILVYLPSGPPKGLQQMNPLCLNIIFSFRPQYKQQGI